MDFDDFGIEELATAGALAEEIADDELERLLLEQSSGSPSPEDTLETDDNCES